MSDVVALSTSAFTLALHWPLRRAEGEKTSAVKDRRRAHEDVDDGHNDDDDDEHDDDEHDDDDEDDDVHRREGKGIEIGKRISQLRVREKQ